MTSVDSFSVNHKQNRFNNSGGSISRPYIVLKPSCRGGVYPLPQEISIIFGWVLLGQVTSKPLKMARLRAEGDEPFPYVHTVWS